jgi:lipopolysaccharide transport system ATP-binding protein
VDEVLAVGDAEFQKKCLGKMESVSRTEGRTVLFVSHNTRAVQTLCVKGIVLEAGMTKCVGTVEEAFSAYTSRTATQFSVEFPVNDSRPSISLVRIDEHQLEQGNLVVDIGFKSPFELNPPVPGLVVSSALGTPVFGTNTRFHDYASIQPKRTEGVLRLVAKALPIHAGLYKLSVWLGDWQVDYDEKREALAFEFKNGHMAANAPNPELIGFVDPKLTWDLVS